MQLPVVPTKPFNVKVANGDSLKCQGRFENVSVLLQGIPFTLPLIGLDMVLGVHWLEQLGMVVCDWKRMTMEFSWKDQRHQLEGIDNQLIQPTKFKTISKEIKQGNFIFLVCLHAAMEKVPQGIQLEMQ